MPHASGYFRTTYSQDTALIQTTTQKATLGGCLVLLAVLPFVTTSFQLDIANQVLLAVVGSVALMLLTGFAGQVSLGHAGLIAAGAFTTGILHKEFGAPMWIGLPASALSGAVLGLVFGLPSLRLKGLYLAVSTLALHFIVIFLAGEYETRRGFSTGIVVSSPIDGGRAWYFALLIAAALSILFALNLKRSRTGRAWAALRDREIVAAALGIDVRAYKLMAFVASATMTSVAGSLFAYYRGFVSVEAFSLYLSIQYVAMVIIGGLGSILGAVLGAVFVTVFPYVVEALMKLLPGAKAMSSYIFALNYALFGLVMMLFLVFEPLGLVGIWKRLQNYFLLWPFRNRTAARGRA